MRRIVPDERARQATTGRPTLFVLLGALCLAGIVFVAWLFWAGSVSPIPAGPDVQSTASTPAQIESQPKEGVVGSPVTPIPVVPSGRDPKTGRPQP